MKIETFLRQSPLFEISRAARLFESQLAQLFGQAGDAQVGFLEGLILTSLLFEKPSTVSPSLLAATFSTTRGNISHCVSSLEAKGFLGRSIDPKDARGYRLALKPAGKKIAMQVVRTLDRLQASFEQQIGVAELESALKTIRLVEQLCSAAPGESGLEIAGSSIPHVSK